MKKRFSFYVVLISFLAFNCQKYGVLGPGGSGPNSFTGSLQGKVVDEGGNPVAGVTVKLGIKTATTDPNGFFKFEDAKLDKAETVVSAERSGYYKAFRVFSATSGVNNIVIGLVYKQLTGTIESNSGGSVSLSNGSKVELPANGVVKQSGGGLYNGTINVFVSYIDPTFQSRYQTTPGSFLGYDKGGNKVLLATPGMLIVELESPTGEKLQIAKNKAATLTTAISSALRANAPATISMWYLDDVTGLWKEEGAASKIGDNYVGEVSHFSYWTCGQYSQIINFIATFVDNFGFPLAERYIVIRQLNGITAAWGTTDSLGQINNPIPANMSLILEVENFCHAVEHTISLSPSSTNISLGTVSVTPVQTKTVTGRLLNCTGGPVTSGYAIVWYGNKGVSTPLMPDGGFVVQLSPCDGIYPNCKIVGVDNLTNQQNATQTFNLTGSLTNVGNITTCGVSAEQFISERPNASVSYSVVYSSSFPDPLFWGYSNYANSTNEAYLTGGNGIMGTFFWFTHTLSTGVFPMTRLSINETFSAITLIPPFNVSLTNYPNQVGEFFEGSFYGNYFLNNFPNDIRYMDCLFRIRRTN